MERYAFFGHHKCASLYVREVIIRLSKCQGLNYWAGSLTNRLPYDFHNDEKWKKRWIKVKEKIKTFDFNFLIHINATNTISKLINHRYKGFHIVRNPRDILVSAYFSHLYSHPVATPWMEIQRAELKKRNQEDGMLYELDTFTGIHLNKMQNWDYQQPNIYETKFETLTTDQTEWNKILKFIEMPYDPQYLQEILDELSFKNKTNREKGEEDKSHHLRKGIQGDWKNHFTPKIEKAFSKYGDLLVKLGYKE